MNPVIHFEMPAEDGSRSKPHEIPGVGLYVSILDTEENRVGLLQPAAMP